MVISTFVFTFLSLSLGLGRAETTGTGDDDPDTTVTVNQSQSPNVQLTAVQATPVVIAKDVNPTEFEGEIINVDYSKSVILVHDTYGRDKRVVVKQGMISTYKTGDYVKVSLMADLKEAKMISVVKEISHFEGTILSVDPAIHQLIVRDSAGKDRTVLLAPGTTAYFKAGENVRIYVIPDKGEARLIRVLG